MTYSDDYEDRPREPVVAEREDIVDERPRTSATSPVWSPAQIIGLIVGIGAVVMGVVAVIRTGFDTDHIYTPVDMVWRMPHSPLFGVIEIGFGVLMILASIVPGGARWLLAFLGACALAFGIVVVVQSVPNRLNHWLGVTDRNGWLYIVVGAVVLVAAIVSPVFGTTGRTTTQRHRQRIEPTPVQ